ncbi:TRAP transporter small permease [Maritalea mediterranea]|uniref:TRAP transporter small permease protein n=1 Tax=Maritalea mediterranea TaxID=2909667 RepID=A0ABS9E5U3_9HYPH|nr:TRAP transporter small permease [Maritalea mediterranea]MCF4098239.1 TRAP transporter small permease [Maritalea mediterranea]
MTHEPKSNNDVLHRAVDGLALLGGALLVGVILVNVWATLLNALAIGFAGDFELTEMGVAIAVFCFLPLCQRDGAHLAADIFTQRLGERPRRLLQQVATLVSLLIATLLLWRMSFGLVDQWRYGYQTAILQLPHWVAFVPILASLFLWSLVALVQLGTGIKDASHD